MTLARLLRCQPWGTSGLDFVPDSVAGRARWYLPWRLRTLARDQSRPSTAASAEPDAASDMHGESERAAETTHAYLRS